MSNAAEHLDIDLETWESDSEAPFDFAAYRAAPTASARRSGRPTARHGDAATAAPRRTSTKAEAAATSTNATPADSCRTTSPNNRLGPLPR